MDFTAAAEDSDVDVFDSTSSLSEPAHARTSSSSSSRKSSYEDGSSGSGAGGAGQTLDDKLSAVISGDQPLEEGHATSDTSGDHPMSSPLSLPPPNQNFGGNSPGPPTVVEWRPQDHGAEVGVAVSLPTPSPRSGRGQSAEPMSSPRDLKEIYGSAVTVTIDPPLDDGGVGGADDEVSRYLGGSGGGGEGSIGGQSSTSRPPSSLLHGTGCSHAGLGELFGKGEDAAMDFDLFESLDESDLAEEEDKDPPPPTRICFLSK